MPTQRAELPRRQAATQFLRVPRVDWARVLTGEKRELRAAGRHALHHVRLGNVPTPVVGYSFQRYRSTCDSALLVVERAWSEPLGAISPESLAAEGFEQLRDFKLYWKARHASVGYRPAATVQCLQLRPWDKATDPELFGRLLLERLFGTWL